MEQKDKKQFATVMAGLAEVFSPDKPGPSSMAMEIYFKALQEYAIEDIERACLSLVENRVFNGLPKPGEIKEAINGPQQDQAILAWQKVDKAVRDHGQYASVRFVDDPVIHGVIEMMGGWPQFQDCPLDEWKWKQKEFERLYGVLKRRGDHPNYLPGIVEIENVGRGRQDATPPPVEIGGEDKPKLRLVEKTEEGGKA